MPTPEVVARYNPESRFGGFTRHCGSTQFYSRIAALLKPGDRVLDFGAGRGAQIDTDGCEFRRGLKILKGRVAHVEGCDVDPAVLENPYLDGAKLFEPGKPLPYEDESFDLIYSSWVFEHVADPAAMAAELVRVLKPGGYICAVTPNKLGYVSIAARAVHNSRHVSVLEKVQPDRLAEDVFPTYYRINTHRAVRKYFGDTCDVVVYKMSSDPSYYFNSGKIYGMFTLIHKFTPAAFHTTLFIFMQKRGREGDA